MASLTDFFTQSTSRPASKCTLNSSLIAMICCAKPSTSSGALPANKLSKAGTLGKDCIHCKVRAVFSESQSSAPCARAQFIKVKILGITNARLCDCAARAQACRYAKPIEPSGTTNNCAVKGTPESAIRATTSSQKAWENLQGKTCKPCAVSDNSSENKSGVDIWTIKNGFRIEPIITTYPVP